MFNHYLKIAWRNLLKNKVQSLISILGLTIGVVFFAYGYHWYKYETTFDGFYPDAGRIYRVYGFNSKAGKQTSSGVIPYIAAQKMIDGFPEIKKLTILYPNFSTKLSHNGKSIGKPNMEFTDEQFFQIFTPVVIAGNITPNTLKWEDDMVVTESFAVKHFTTPESAIGKILTHDDSYMLRHESYSIKAVIADQPSNSVFRNEVYVRDKYGKSTLQQDAAEDIQWQNENGVKAFILLKEGVNAGKFRQKLMTYAIDNSYNNDLLLKTTPLTAQRQTIIDPFDTNPFDVKYIRTFILVATLIILASFFNFFNIHIHTALTRKRELNLRRVNGASVKNIFVQIAIEITFIIVISTLLSLWLIEITSSHFENMFSTVVIRQKIYLITVISICAITLILFVMTFLFLYRFINKASITHNKTTANKLSVNRISLSVQLAVSVFFIFSSALFYRQISFMNHADWGFNQDNTLRLLMNVEDVHSFLNEVRKLPMVEDLSYTGAFTIEKNVEKAGYSMNYGVLWEGKPEDFNSFFQVFDIDEGFIKNMGLTILTGRDFNRSDYQGHFDGTITKVIINETAQRIMDMDDPIGKRISIPSRWFDSEGHAKVSYEIVGVVKDFHSVGFQTQIPPVVFIYGPLRHGGYFHYVHITPGTESQAVEALSNLYSNYRQHTEKTDQELIKPMSQLLNELHKDEQNLLKLFLTISLLYILIAIFGIYSVSQRETQRRRKEIAIRKTSGAKTKEIMQLFFREYLTITLVASAIALPFAWLFMHRWLQSFAYHISISWWMFVVVILLVAAIVIITIFSQVFKASNQNPAEVVKAE